MRAGARAALVFAALAALSAAAAAQDQTPQARCLVTGPLVISAYSAFLAEAAQQDRHAAAKQGQNVASLMTLYQGLGCPTEPLQQAIECVTAKLVAAGAASDPMTTHDAQACMREAGMPVR